MKFSYVAKKGLDETVRGTLEAETREHLLQRLVDQGLFPISVDAMEADPVAKLGAKPGEQKKAKRFVLFTPQASGKDVSQFAQKLAILMRAKLELLKAVKITVDQTEEDSGFRPVVENMYQTMRQGKTFSEALGLYPALFSPLFVNIVKSGEASGAIDAALTQINAYMGREEAIRRKVATAMAYPAILLCVGIGSLAVLMTVVIPKLKPIFASMKQTLPPITKMIFALSDLSRDGMLTCALLFFAAIYFFYTQRKAAWFLALGSQIKRSIPMLKDLTAHQEYAHFSRSLGMLVKSRTPVMQALDVARRTVSDPRLAAALVKVHGELAGGSGLAKSLEQNTDLPPFFVKMIAVGEESGRLGDVLDEVTAAYADQVEADIAIMSSLIEPLLILVMGVVLGGVVLSVLIPMFQLTQAVGS